MMLKKCGNCNKIMKATFSTRNCVICGKPLCYACRSRKMMCCDCEVQSCEQNVINEYYKEKYAERDTIKC